MQCPAAVCNTQFMTDRVLSTIFSLGEKIRLEIDWGGGGCGHRLEFSRGSGGMSPEKFCNFEPCESGSEVF